MQKLASTSCVPVTVATVAAAIADGDQVGVLLNIPGAFRSGDTCTGILQALNLVDASDTKPALDILFFSDTFTPASNDNDPVSVSDAQMAANFLGRVHVATTDWQTILAGGGGNAVANPSFQPFGVRNSNAGSKLYALVVCRTAVTLTANCIQLIPTILQD